MIQYYRTIFFVFLPPILRLTLKIDIIINMLIQFTTSNFRSFGKEMTLTLTASKGIKDKPGSNITAINKNTSILNSVAFYGANSSGKSNFILAAGAMRMMVVQSVKLNEGDPLPYDPFILSTRESLPTKFEVIFHLNRKTYKYGFEYTREKIAREWLFLKSSGKSEKPLFTRNSDTPPIVEPNFDIQARNIGTDTKLNANRLLISLSGQLGGDISNSIINWFDKNLRFISGIDDSYSQYTRRRVYADDVMKDMVQAFLGKMKLGFDSFIPQKIDFENIGLPQGLPQEVVAQLKKDPFIQISSLHNVYDKLGNAIRTIKLDLDGQESAGTNKVFNLAGPILDSLNRGVTLFVDELDSQMHPLLTWKIIEMFNSPVENPNGAQLVFSTHDTHLLSKKLLRRDQIWFTEKDSKECSTIYPMMKAAQAKLQLKHAPRNDSNYEKNYINGLYGAIPFMINESANE